MRVFGEPAPLLTGMPVGRDLGSKHGKGKQKTKANNGPGRPRKKKKKATEKKERAQALARRNKGTQIRQRMDAKVENYAPTVQNARGHSRSFECNMMFLTLFCSLYTETAAALEGYRPRPPCPTLCDCCAASDAAGCAGTSPSTRRPRLFPAR